MGSYWKIHSTPEIPEVGITERSHDSNSFSVPTHPGVLFHSQVWRPRLDDTAHILLGFN